MIAIGSERIWYDEAWHSGFLLISNGKVEGVVDTLPQGKPIEVHEHQNDVVMPGIVDTHVHINEPGRTEWEGYDSATKAAAAGGITTVADMPLNCLPVTTTLPALQQKLVALEGKLTVDCAFHGGVIPGNADQLKPMFDAGVKSFKAFLIDSGIPEFPEATRKDLEEAMPILAEIGATLLVHAECDDGKAPPQVDPKSYQEFLATRPHSWEQDAVQMMMELSQKYSCPVHIVHLSSAKCLSTINEARKNGVNVTVETCPHYLCLNAEEIPDGDGRYKCCPPIREKENQGELWEGVLRGEIDCVVSDHSPCTPHLKCLETENLKDAWGGISSLQFGLPLIWQALQSRGEPIETLIRLMCSATSQLIRRQGQKGCLSSGSDADVVVWQPDDVYVVERSAILHRHKETPYMGFECKGRVVSTYLRGRRVFHNGRIVESGTGACLL